LSHAYTRLCSPFAVDLLPPVASRVESYRNLCTLSVLCCRLDGVALGVLARLALVRVVCKLQETFKPLSLRHTGGPLGVCLARRAGPRDFAEGKSLSPDVVAMLCHGALPPVDNTLRACGNLASTVHLRANREHF
jgi:hypothetical protein